METRAARKSGSASPIGRPLARERPGDRWHRSRTLTSGKTTGCPRRNGSEGVPASWRRDAFRIVPPRFVGPWVALGLGTLAGRGLFLEIEHLVRAAVAVSPGWNLGLAAVAPTAMIALEVRSVLLGRRSHGWSGRTPRAIVAWGLVAAALPTSVPVLGPEAVLAGLAILGFLAGVTATILCILPAYLPVLPPRRSRSGSR